MKLYMTLLAFFSLMTIGCGVDYNGDKFNKEKDQRIEGDRKLSDSESESEIVALLFASVTQTATMQWAYVSSRLGLPIDTYEKAEAICQSIGFDLPTAEMLNSDGKTIPAIKSLASTEESLLMAVYLKGVASETLRFIVCTRLIP